MPLCILDEANGESIYKIELNFEPEVIIFVNQAWTKDSSYEGVIHYKKATTYKAKQLSYINPKEAS